MAAPSLALSAELSPKVVAFVDILGFKEVIRRMARDRHLQALVVRELRSTAALGRYLPNPHGSSVRMTSFSDCSLLSAPEGQELAVATNAQALAVGLLHNGLPSRGAMTIGKLYHESDVVVGEALVEAYEAEQGAAIYPRIILSDEVAERLHDQADAALRCELMKQDADGFWFLNLFAASHPRWEAYHAKVREHLVRALEGGEGGKIPTWGVLAKLRWLVREFNESLTQGKESSVQPIVLNTGPSSE